MYSKMIKRSFSTTGKAKIPSPPLVYISGEEMTRYTMQLIMDKWIHPHVDTSKWEYYDLSCVNRDKTKDQELRDCITAGAKIGSIFKEPTITPTEVQKNLLGLSQAWGSPNGQMRRGWNGITISRDTIHIKGVKLGYKNPVFFERHAVGGEYSAGFGNVGRGSVTTVFTPEDRSPAQIIDHRMLDDEKNAIVTYHNPLDNVKDLAHHFFKRCLKAKITPYVVTKKTVFKWQEGFWVEMKKVFDEHYKEDFLNAGLLDKTGKDLEHLISDAASMQIIRWIDGGFGMAAHNYDGDMLTDEIAQVHRSPGFLTSNLIGKREDGTMIKQYEASHGTVADMWKAHLQGEETSLNPLGMVEALLGAMQHSVVLANDDSNKPLTKFTKKIRKCVHLAFLTNRGTRDLCGADGYTTEQFVDHVGEQLLKSDKEIKALSKISHLKDTSDEEDSDHEEDVVDENPEFLYSLDDKELEDIFSFMDRDNDGSISNKEFKAGLEALNISRAVSMSYYDLKKNPKSNPRKYESQKI
eukprot:UN06895